MAARQTKDELMDVEWEFDTREELLLAADKESRVCGDDFRASKNGCVVEIFNHHQQSVRWKGCMRCVQT